MIGHASSLKPLTTSGLTSLPGPFPSADEAFDAAATALLEAPTDEGFPSLEIIGDFVIPPVDGPPSRDFQTLHFDFGLPLDPKRRGDVARYTALHIPIGSPPSTAITRLVPLSALLRQTSWPGADELLERFAAYGQTHGAWDYADGYTEGSLARIIEAAADFARLPSVKDNPDFLCGNEFQSLSEELDFFDSHGLDVAEAQIEITIRPGTVAIFDNLSLAHGRRGIRQPGELRQRVFGYRALDVGQQRALRDRVLAVFNQVAHGHGSSPCGSELRDRHG